MKAKLTRQIVEKAQPKATAYDIRDTEIGGFLLRVSPSGGKVYYVEYRRPSSAKRTRYRLGDGAVLSAIRAREGARDFLAKVQLGDDPAEARRMAKARDLRTFLSEAYGPWVTENRKAGHSTLKRIEASFSPILGLRLHEITPYRIEQWRRAKRKRKGNRGATLNRDVAVLSAALSWGVKHGYLRENPIAGMDRLPEHDSQDKTRYLTAEEETRLTAALDTREERLRVKRDSFNKWRRDRGYREYTDLRAVRFADFLKPLVIVSLNTGIRRGEAFDLTWPDVDLGHGMITIQRAAAKSGKARHIPLNDAALDTLTAWRDQSGDQGLVFKSPRGGGRLYSIKKAWAEVLGEAGIAGFRWHDLRHTFASKLVQAGVDLNTVRELLGHSDIKMTLRYAHLSPESKRAAVSKLDAPANVVALAGRAKG